MKKLPLSHLCVSLQYYSVCVYSAIYLRHKKKSAHIIYITQKTSSLQLVINSPSSTCSTQYISTNQSMWYTCILYISHCPELFFN